MKFGLKRFFSKRSIFIVLCTLVLLGLAMAFTFSLYRDRRAASLKPSDASLPGLKEKVIVQFDERGVPFIRAANAHDLYMAQGYITARDRLWQMDLLRRTARGELSEILGSATLAEDKRRRLFNFAALAEDMVNRTSPQMREALEAYAQGVNAYIESRSFGTWPIEFTILRYNPRPWLPADSWVITKLYAETLSESWRQDIERAAMEKIPPEQRQQINPETSPLDVVLVGKDPKPDSKTPVKNQKAMAQPSQSAAPRGTPESDLRALAEFASIDERTFARVGLYNASRTLSNGWAVSGKHSVSGKPMLANDPHLNVSVPSIWHMAFLSSPQMRVAGVTLPGLPGILIGHNQYIAWGITNLTADVQDLYNEKFNSANKAQYQVSDGWHQAQIRHEEIKVRNRSLGTSVSVVPYDVVSTIHGPIIFEKGDSHYALRWTALDQQAPDYESFLLIDSARNWDEFRAALSHYAGPPISCIYADVAGHIGFYSAGKIPIRKKGDGSLPYDGTTDDDQWASYIPFDKMPHSFDPPSQEIVTANQRLVGADYPYHLTNVWPIPYRAHRISELLSQKQKFTLEDFREIQGDTFSSADAIFVAEVLKMARVNAANSPEWQNLLEVFDGWDGKATANSRALLLSVHMHRAFERRIMSTVFGNDENKELLWPTRGTFINEVITTRPTAWLPQGTDSYESLILACYHDAVTQMRQAFGPNEALWTWGNGPQRNFNHPLAGLPEMGSMYAIPTFPRSTGGSSDTVNAGANVSMRMLIDTSDWDQTRQSLSVGESGDPGSACFKDQLTDWFKVKPRVFPFTDDTIAGITKNKITLSPANR